MSYDNPQTEGELIIAAWQGGDLAGSIDAALTAARTELAERLASIVYEMVMAGRSAKEVAAAVRATAQTDNDKCPRCGGSFKTTGGKPTDGPQQCQVCASDEYFERAAVKGGKQNGSL